MDSIKLSIQLFRMQPTRNFLNICGISMIALSFFENEDVSAATKRDLVAGLKNAASGKISLNRVELKLEDIQTS